MEHTATFLRRAQRRISFHPRPGIDRREREMPAPFHRGRWWPRSTMDTSCRLPQSSLWPRDWRLDSKGLYRVGEGRDGGLPRARSHRYAVVF